MSEGTCGYKYTNLNKLLWHTQIQGFLTKKIGNEKSLLPEITSGNTFVFQIFKYHLY